MSVNKLTYDGADYEDEIVSGAGSLRMSHAMVGETLAVDNLTTALITRDLPVRYLASDQGQNDFFKTADGKIFCVRGGAKTPVFKENEPGYYHFDNDLVGKYFLNKQRQLAVHKHEQVYYSAVYRLGQSKHFGGLYTGEAADVVIADIIGDVIPYTVDDEIASVQIYGYLPHDWRRDNLKKLLMAVSGVLRNSPDGTLIITSMSDTVTGIFNSSRVFRGGAVEDETVATAVQVTEHNYLATTEEVTLFNDGTITTETLTFKEPYHSLSITGGTIISSGANYCTFSGAGAVILKGLKYEHVTRIITYGTVPTGSYSDVVKTVSNNMLLTPNNAAIVCEKLYKFLTVAKSIKAKLVFGGERPGDAVQVLHPFTKQLVNACIKSMDIIRGETELRATSVMLVDYIPPGVTAGFENYIVLTGAGTWTVPEGVTRIRVIAVDPGSVGSAGARGQNGTTSSGGTGGSPGAAGNGGKILEISLPVTPLTEIVYSCGTHTIFDGLSAEAGRTYAYGYTEPKSGLVLGKKGNAGELAGGAGTGPGIGADVTKDGVTYHPGASGSAYTNYGLTAYGGNGGGAASAGNGGTGQNGYVSKTGGYSYSTGSNDTALWAGSPALNGVNGYSSFTFNADTGVFTANGSAVHLTLASVGSCYVVNGSSMTRYYSGGTSGNHYGNVYTRTGTAPTYTRQYGGGGDGAPGAPGDDATDYGQGGDGGDGGGGGGKSQSYTNARTGLGGAGGAGGAGGPGVIIVYFGGG